MYRLAMVFLVFLIFPLSMYAQGNVFLGYSYLNATTLRNDFGSSRASLNGWNGSLEGKFLPWVGIVADLSGHYGKENIAVICPGIACPTGSTNARQYNFVFGPRVSVTVGKLKPFAHYLVGASHITTSGSTNIGSDISFSQVAGGGLDYQLFPLLSWRFQGDFLQTRFFSNTQNSFRMSTGIVLHF